jgi:hypothetical protein
VTVEEAEAPGYLTAGEHRVTAEEALLSDDLARGQAHALIALAAEINLLRQAPVRTS